MSKVKNKYKICFQNRINLWGQQKLFTFRNKKWSWLSSKNKKTIFGSIFFIKHRKSLRFLYKGFIRLRSLLRYSRSIIKQKQFLSILNKFKNKSPKFYLFLNKLNTRLDFVLYNSGFIGSVYKFRKVILHGGILVNGSITKSPSIFLREGDLVEFNPFCKYAHYKHIYSTCRIKKPVCSFLEINYNELTITILPLLKKNLDFVPYENTENLSLLNFLSFN